MFLPQRGRRSQLTAQNVDVVILPMKEYSVLLCYSGMLQVVCNYKTGLAVDEVIFETHVWTDCGSPAPSANILHVFVW